MSMARTLGRPVIRSRRRNRRGIRHLGSEQSHCHRSTAPRPSRRFHRRDRHARQARLGPSPTEEERWNPGKPSTSCGPRARAAQRGRHRGRDPRSGGTGGPYAAGHAQRPASPRDSHRPPPDPRGHRVRRRSGRRDPGRSLHPLPVDGVDGGRARPPRRSGSGHRGRGLAHPALEPAGGGPGGARGHRATAPRRPPRPAPRGPRRLSTSTDPEHRTGCSAPSASSPSTAAVAWPRACSSPAWPPPRLKACRCTSRRPTRATSRSTDACASRSPPRSSCPVEPRRCG